jgi:hypothetical protein
MTVLVLAEHGEQLERAAAGLAGERLVAVTGVTGSSHCPTGYAEVLQVRRFATSTEVELAALRLTRHGTLSRIVATGHDVQLRAACLREHLGVPGQGRDAALRCVDLLALRDALHDAGVAVVPARELRFAADLARHAADLGLPVRLRRRRAAGWPATHVLGSRADLLAVLRTAPDLAGLVLEPVRTGEPEQVPLDSTVGRAVQRAIGAPAGTVTRIDALRLADGRLLVDSVATPDTSS